MRMNRNIIRLIAILVGAGAITVGLVLISTYFCKLALVGIGIVIIYKGIRG